MHETTGQDAQALDARLAQARERLAGRMGELHEVDGELEGLSTERRRHELLQNLCAGLEELETLGGSALFWGEGGDRTRAHVDGVRGRIHAFEKQLTEIEGRREGLQQEIDRLQLDVELIEDDLFELRAREEARKQEWIIEREVEEFPVLPLRMPWSRGGEDDDRFWRALLAALLASILLGILFPLIPLPIPERGEPIEVPERLTSLIREEPPPPPPPPIEQPKPEEKLQQESSEEVAQQKQKVPEQKPTKKVPPKGILAFREKFSGLAKVRPASRLGSQARIRNVGNAASGRPTTRSMVALETSGSSGGINVASLSRGSGGSAEGIEGVDVGRVTSSIGTAAGEERPLSSGPGPARTDEEIQIVFDRHKAALYRLYNRELRRDPTLKGQIVLRIRIEPDGSVSLCEVQSSDMNAPALSKQVVTRVEKFDFGAKEGVGAITILYPIDFLPAA